MRDIVELIRGCLATAQDRQRKYADLAQKDREYEVGDQGQECQAIQSLVEISQGRGVDLGIREPPVRKVPPSICELISGRNPFMGGRL
ncbi:hypothetical protein AgCh_018004 [Apium graveolens]